MKDDDWDFGFSAIDETNLEAVSNKEKELNDKRVKTTNKLFKIEKMIMPLIEKLMKDDDKPYIHWPNRKEVLEKYKKELLLLLNE